MQYLGPALLTVVWLVALMFAALGTVTGLRGGPLRLPFRSNAGHVTLSGTSARIAGVMYGLLALVMLAFPFLLFVFRGLNGQGDR